MLLFKQAGALLTLKLLLNMTALNVPTSACSVSTFASTLDSIKYQISDASSEYGFSKVLMLVTLRQWCDEQLRSTID